MLLKVQEFADSRRPMFRVLGRGHRERLTHGLREVRHVHDVLKRVGQRGTGYAWSGPSLHHEMVRPFEVSVQIDADITGKLRCVDLLVEAFDGGEVTRKQVVKIPVGEIVKRAIDAVPGGSFPVPKVWPPTQDGIITVISDRRPTRAELNFAAKEKQTPPRTCPKFPPKKMAEILRVYEEAPDRQSTAAVIKKFEGVDKNNVGGLVAKAKRQRKQVTDSHAGSAAFDDHHA